MKVLIKDIWCESNEAMEVTSDRDALFVAVGEMEKCDHSPEWAFMPREMYRISKRQLRLIQSMIARVMSDE